MPRGKYLRPKQKAEQASHVDKLPFPTATSALLNKREETHGRFINTAVVAQKLKRAIRESQAANSAVLTESMRESLDQIATKIARIICGNPRTREHWLDIEGYAHLISERLS